MSSDPVDQPSIAQQRKNTGNVPVKGNTRFPAPMMAVHPNSKKYLCWGNFSSKNPAEIIIRID